MSPAEAHQPHTEGEHAHLAGPLAVVHVEEPVEAQVCGEVRVDVGPVRGDAAVQRGQHHDHVGHVNETVILAPEAVLVKHIRHQLQIRVIHCRKYHSKNLVAMQISV